MREIFKSMSERILENALGALRQANMHSAFYDPGSEHWGNMSVLNAAHAGELVIKAIIAKEHPLLVFKNIFDFGDSTNGEMELEALLKRGRTHDFQHLPKVLWAVCNEAIPDRPSFERLRELRNSIQHFFHPAGLDGIGGEARWASIEFLYRNVDPLLKKHFGLNAIEFHEDHSLGYDYLVAHIVRCQLKFSVPDDFNLTEFDLSEALEGSVPTYRYWIQGELDRIGRQDLLGASKLGATD